MNRRRNMRRRHSLPHLLTPSTLNGCRVVPEGSDVFQQALEDLYLSDPKPSQSNNVTKSNIGPGIIEEEDEEEEEDDEEEEVAAERSDRNYFSRGRRYSSPAYISHVPEDEIDGKSEQGKDRKQEMKDLLKKHSQNRKDYFAKHGHWPSASVAQMTASRSTLVTNHPRKATQDIAFGSTITKQ